MKLFLYKKLFYYRYKAFQYYELLIEIKLWKKKLLIKELDLKNNLLEIGCEHIISQLIAVEAGGSQKIVDIDPSG
jgi:hypothetical protein